MVDPRVEFARRLQLLREAAGLSLRQLESESVRTRRPGGEPPVRLKRSTISGMTSPVRPVRPELPNFEVFVDTCLRVAAEKGVRLPADLADRERWDRAYRDLRDQLDRAPRRQVATREQPVPRPVDPPPALPAVVPERALLTRRRALLFAPVALAAVGAAVVIPELLDDAGQGASQERGTSADEPYDPAGKLLSSALALDDPVWSVALGVLDGEALAVVGRGGGTVQLWNPVTGRARSNPIADHDKPVYSIALHGSTAVSASVDGTVRLWDLTTQPPTSSRVGSTVSAGINSVAVTTLRGAAVAVTGGDDRTVRMWDLARADLDGRVMGKVLDAEVKSIAIGALRGMPVVVSGAADGTVRLWDLESATTGQVLGSHESAVGALAVGAVGDRAVLVSGGEDGDTRIWDLSATTPSGRSVGRIHNAVKTVAIGTIGSKRVAIAGADDNTIRLWDLATGLPFGAGLTGPATGPESIAIATYGNKTIIVSGNWDGTIWTWRV